MEKQNFTLLLTKIECLRSSTESGHDDVYLKIYPNGNLGNESTYFYGSPIKMKGQASGDAVRYLDISINATYLDSLLIKVWDKDNDPNPDDLLGVITITRNDALEGYKTAIQTTGDAQAQYNIYWRVINKPIPTVRILGLYCQKGSSGCNAAMVEAVCEAVSSACDAASESFGKVKTPKGQAISKGFEAASLIIGELAGVIEWIADAAEGDDDVYLQHIDRDNPDDRRGAFCPPSSSGQKCMKMNDGDEVHFIERYGEYFRFPMDQGDVTIQIREGDPDRTHISLGSITFTEAMYNQWLPKGAAVMVASEYLVGSHEGAIYHLCFSMALEDWANPPVAPEDVFPPATDAWTNWQAMGGERGLTAAPALIAWGDKGIDCYASGPRGELLVRATTSDGTAWSDWAERGGTMKGRPAATFKNERVDVVVRGTDDHLWHLSRSANGTWGNWQNVGGGTITSGPALASWAEGRLDCFARGSNGQLLHRVYAGGAWNAAWEDLSGGFVDAPAAVSWGANRIDVLVRNGANHLWHKAWDGSKWTDWAKLGDTEIYSSPSLTSRGAGKLDCFARTSKGTVIHRVYENNAWSDWVEIPGGTIKDTPTAVAHASGRLDIVAMGMDSLPWHRTKL